MSEKCEVKNSKYTCKEFASLTLFAFLIFTFAFLFSACGKRRPPLAPIETIGQSTLLLSGIQRGNQVVLNFPAPLRNASDASVQSIRRIDVYRLAENTADPLSLTQEDFAARSTLIGSIDYTQIKDADGALEYIDSLSFGAKPVRLRYSVRFVNASNQRAAFSNFLLIEPAARVAQPPTLAEVSETERALIVRWRAPATNVDGSTPVNLLGYNVYRSSPATAASLAQTPLNAQPLTRTEFNDANFESGAEYTYVVRSVSLGMEGAALESLNSNRLTVKPTDRFPPSAPSAISIAAAPNRLSLFFPANPETDIAGYIIFRSPDPQVPKDTWTRLTRTPIARTTYQDDAVESGKRYYYYIIAVDNAGNTSATSEVASEIAL
jgi:hypothetical protein